MKNIIKYFCINFVLFLIFCSFESYSQEKAAKSLYKSIRYHSKYEYHKAISELQNIVHNYPKSIYYKRALGDLVYHFKITKQYDSALVYSKLILSKNFDSKDYKAIIPKQKFPKYDANIELDLGNYNYYACLYLSDIYFELQQYDSSLSYILLADTLYKYNNDCGTGAKEAQLNLFAKYSEIMFSKYSKSELLEIISQNAQIDLINSKLTKYNFLLLYMIEFDKHLRNQFYESLNNIQFQNNEYYLNFNNIKVEIVYSNNQNQEMEYKNQIAEKIKKYCSFYLTNSN